MASAVIGALRVNLGIDTAAFSDGLKRAQSGLQKFGAFAKQGLLAAGVAAGAAAGAFGMMVKGTIDSADEMSKAAQKFGIPIEELSRLKYAADLSGVSFEALGTGVRKLSQNMNDAAKGMGEGKEAFEQLGISVTNADGSLKSSSQVMAEIADKFAAMPDGAEKTALAMDLMGRAGANMIPLLNGGSEALNKLMAEADTFGQVFTQEMGSQAEAFNDNLSRLQGSLANIAAGVATDLLPHLERFSAWLVENAPAIQQWVAAIVQQFVVFGQNLAQLKTEIDALIAGFVAFRDGVTTALNEIDATLRAWSEQIVGIFQAIPGQMMEIGDQIIDGLWQGLQSKWESVKSWVSGVANYIPDIFRSETETHSPSQVMHDIGVDIMQGLANGMEGMRGDVESVAGNIASTVADAFTGLITGSRKVEDVLKSLLDQLIRMFANKAFQAIFSAFSFGGGGALTSFASGILSGQFAGLFATGGTLGAGQWGIAGEAGPEIVRGPAEIIPAGAASARGASTLTVRFVDSSGNEVKTAEVKGGDMGVDLALDRLIAQKVASPGSEISRALENRFGLRNTLASR
ncbi:phage tail tape measure protein [Chelativorans sp. AA-79]|uniref:phage tail tape measure protein n=1 Tax=Chelativorans sp. AA-79 TaxID=3028735 RepID=UPI0023F92816|nr:phage tail tape measure protein [Chelativorans sp. AA-79]WEX07369.1 phage tail tape measure protein [Chelativorans sp. AA-79]